MTSLPGEVALWDKIWKKRTKTQSREHTTTQPAGKMRVDDADIEMHRLYTSFCACSYLYLGRWRQCQKSYEIDSLWNSWEVARLTGTWTHIAKQQLYWYGPRLEFLFVHLSFYLYRQYPLTQHSTQLSTHNSAISCLVNLPASPCMRYKVCLNRIMPVSTCLGEVDTAIRLPLTRHSS